MYMHRSKVGASLVTTDFYRYAVQLCDRERNLRQTVVVVLHGQQGASPSILIPFWPFFKFRKSKSSKDSEEKLAYFIILFLLFLAATAVEVVI